jgi:hypothetical protein
LSHLNERQHIARAQHGCPSGSGCPSLISTWRRLPFYQFRRSVSCLERWHEREFRTVRFRTNKGDRRQIRER